MATAFDYTGLLGGTLTPQEMQQQIIEKQALQQAQLNPSQQLAYMGSIAGAKLGQGVAGLLGENVQDPVVKRYTQLHQLSQGLDVEKISGLEEYTQRLKQAGFTAEAAQLGQVLETRKQQAAQARLTAAKATKELQGFEREDQLRAELAKLGADAAPKDILKVVMKYGDVNKVLTSLQASEDKAAQREATAEQKALQREADLRRDRERAQDRADLARLVAGLRQEGQAAKPLSTKDIGMVNDLSAAFKDASAGIDEANKFTSLLDDGKMKFGAIENVLSTVRSASGQTNQSDVAKSDFNKWITASINAVLNQAKGVQARDDAQRAKEQILEALDKNDPKLVRNGIQRIKKLLENTKDDAISGLELLSEERNRDFTGRLGNGKSNLGTKENPIVLK